MPTINVPPTANLNELIAANPEGTNFLLQAGVHRMRTITPKTGNSFTGVYKQGKLASILSGARVLKGWKYERGCWWVGGQTQQGLDPTHDVCQVPGSACTLPEDLFFDNQLMKRVLSLLEVRPGTWFFDYNANRIYVGDNPHGHFVETSVLPHLYTSGAIGINDVILEDLLIEKYATPTSYGAVVLGNSAGGSVNWGIQRCEVRYCHGGAIWNDTASFAKENYIHHNGQFGFVGAGSDIVIVGNEIAYNNTVGYNIWWGAGGSKWVWTGGMIVSGNYSHHNDGPGLWTDINDLHVLYEDNVCEYNTRAGIFHEISYDAVIRRNKCRFNGTRQDYPWWTTGAGIEVVNSRNVEVYENILEDNWQNITGLQDPRVDGGNSGPYVMDNFRVHDNRVRNTLNIPGGGRTGCIVFGSAPPFVPSYDRNHYELSANPTPFFLPSPDEQLDVAGWQRRGQDINGTFVNV